MDRGLRASAVESKPVHYADIRLGVVVDVLLDDSFRRLLGFDVLCGDRAHRYLPLLACDIRDSQVAVSSALVLLKQELDFYRERGRSLTSVRGFPVRRGPRELGVIQDLIFKPTGELLGLVVESDAHVQIVQARRDLVVGADALRPAV